ncbi:MAG: cytochrome c [Comamonadaceae bacterium]
MPKHIFRLVTLIIGLLVVAVIGAPYLTVDSFYRFGHYRANAVPEIAAKVPVHQTAKYCQSCHTERHAVWSAGSHKSVNCEICHGAALGHTDKNKLPIPKDSIKLCTLCHEAMTGRPATQPQIDVGKHNSPQQCIVCHNPHTPKIVANAVKVTGNAAAGKKLAGDCATCHGADGNSPNDTWPTLAGQNAAYLARILGAYKSGDQKDAMMTPLAQDLSDADIQNLAVYFASVSCKGAPPAKPIGNVAAGKALAENCAACHGATGAGANPAWPKLAAQKPVYMVNSLKAFRAGLRKDPMMSGAAKNLSDANIADLSAFYATQSCQSTK